MSQISMFCGHHPDCDVFESESMFNRALRNFERWFVVTGVLEHLDMSLNVMESFLPRYFKGSTNISQKFNHNNVKPIVRKYFREQIAKNMTKEIEFYDIVKQRLIKQFMSIS